MNRTAHSRIKQAVGRVVRQDNSFYWIRISRAYMTTLVTYWRSQPNFYYMTIYEIEGYKKGERHKLGRKIGYITLNGSYLSYNGVYETAQSEDYKNRMLK